MKKKMMALLLIGTLVLSMLPGLASATPAEETAHSVYEPVQVQFLTDAKFSEGTSSFVTLSIHRNKAVLWSRSREEHIVLDPFGNMVATLSKDLNGYSFLTDRIMSACVPGTNFALFYDYVQKTDYAYEGFRVYKDHLCGIRPDKSVDFYDLQLNPMPAPTVESGWEVYDFAANGVSMVRRLKGGVNLDSVPKYEYNICDRNGKILMSGNTTSEIMRYNDSLLYYLRNGYPRYLTLEGVDLKDGYVKRMISSPSETRYVIVYEKDGEMQFMVTDARMNVIFDSVNASTQYQYNDVQFLNDDLLLLKETENAYSVIDVFGKRQMSFTGEEVKVLGGKDSIVSEVSLPIWGFYVRNGETCEFYDLELEPILQLTDVRSVGVNAYYLVVTRSDGTKTVFSKAGEPLFDIASDVKYEFVDGVILQRQNGLYAVCDQSGAAITPFQYEQYVATRKYGLLNLRRKDTRGYYLVNSAGQELNGTPLLTSVRFSNQDTLAVYQIDSNYGVLRYVGADDPTFLDAPANQWYHEAVEYCAENGLFAGTAVGKFSPDDAMTRAMLVSVLWRLDGKPAPEGTASFADVQRGAWYADAVCWAAENEIVFGVGDGKFAPDDNITREQIAAIMLRYAKKKGYDTQEKTDISSFADSSRVSSYAVEAIQWANAAGILSGSKEGSQVLLLPQNNATRAQLASILMRFVKNIA